MMKPKFIGTVSFEDISKTFDPNEAWKPLGLDEVPYLVVNPAPSYLFTLGSGCYSAPTISIYNMQYISGIDIFRQDIRGANIMIDIDHYIAVPFQNSFGIYLEPPDERHNLTLHDSRLNYVKPEWFYYLRDVLERKVKI